MSKVIHVTLVARSVLPTLAHSEPADVTARNEAVICEYLEKINRGDAMGAAADWAEDAQNFGQSVSRADVQSTLEDILDTFPDYHVNVVELTAAGMRWSFAAMSPAPIGKSASATRSRTFAGTRCAAARSSSNGRPAMTSA